MTAKYQQAGAQLPAILTKHQAAELLRCTTRYIERQIHAGRLRACKPTGKFVRIYRRDLDAFLLSRASIAEQPATLKPTHIRKVVEI